jgi:hypothetical protein
LGEAEAPPPLLPLRALPPPPLLPLRALLPLLLLLLPGFAAAAAVVMTEGR